MALSEDQIALLRQPLDAALVAQREAGASRKVSYLEGHEAINAANRIFGFGCWSHTVDRIDCRQIGQQWLYTALVSVQVEGCALHQDIGAGTALKDTADEHDKAVKTAVTDGIKRALRVYGDQFGNSLYDRDNAIHDEVRASHQANRPAPRPAPPPARTEATPAGGATTPVPERPANIRDLAAAIPDTRTLAREETQARAAEGQVVLERRRDGTVALNNVPLGEDGTAMFEALRKATTLDALGKEWTAIVANRTALSAPQLDILIRWKEQRKSELTVAQESPAVV